MMLPLASYRDAGDAVLLGPEGQTSAGTFFARVRELADALPDAPFAINLCETRLGFMLGFAAALVRGQTSLLPSGQGRGDWQQLAQQYSGASIICDRDIDTDQAFDLTPYLEMQASPQGTLSIPSIAEDLAAAILFTSGSTGRPVAHAKSWGQLTRGAANWLAALGWVLPARHAVVGSVPPQHMFGLESTVMLAWYAGIPVHAHKPLLPADLEAAFAQCARPCWWMTTPLHLRPLLQSVAPLPLLAGIVASTMSLSPTLAAAAEFRWNVPVVEIYGSTETGALATRRTAVEQWWAPLDGVELNPLTEGDVTRIRASGSHIDVPVFLADELRFNPDGRFMWLGRSTDMLKIGGKRASLSALNQWIAEVPRVDDAVYFVPDATSAAASHDETHPARRLVAFYVSETLSPDDVKSALRARVDPVFVPRLVIRTPSLPRDANGKLPHAALVSLFSRLRMDNDAPEPPGAHEPLLVVPMSHPALQGHFPGNPVVPGVVILSHVEQAIRRQLPHVVPGTLLMMRFHKLLRPDQSCTVHAALHGHKVKVEVREQQASGGALIAVAQWACEVRADMDPHA